MFNGINRPILHTISPIWTAIRSDLWLFFLKQAEINLQPGIVSKAFYHHSVRLHYTNSDIPNFVWRWHKMIHEETFSSKKLDFL